MNLLFHLSHSYCIPICAVLIPLNFGLALTNLWLGYRGQVSLPLGLLGIVAALGMMLHVYTWFAIGVITLHTYGLLALASFSLLSSLWNPHRLEGNTTS